MIKYIDADKLAAIEKRRDELKAQMAKLFADLQGPPKPERGKRWFAMRGRIIYGQVRKLNEELDALVADAESAERG